VLTRKLRIYSERHGGSRRALTLDSLLEW
jgi:hypothetical protein